MNEQEQKAFSKFLSLMTRNKIIDYIQQKKRLNPLGTKYIFLLQSVWNYELEECLKLNKAIEYFNRFGSADASYHIAGVLLLNLYDESGHNEFLENEDYLLP